MSIGDLTMAYFPLKHFACVHFVIFPREYPHYQVIFRFSFRDFGNLQGLQKQVDCFLRDRFYSHKNLNFSPVAFSKAKDGFYRCRVESLKDFTSEMITSFI